MMLVWLILVPFIGGLLCWLSEQMGRGVPRWIALFSMVLLFGMGMWIWVESAHNPLMQIPNAPRWIMEYQQPWIERFGISFYLGIDGLSLLLVILTGLLGVMAVGCSWREIQRHVGFFYLNLLWNLGGVVGVFLSLDLFLFFFFWEMMLVPMFFLIALWGHSGTDGKSRIYAATKFFIFTQASGLLLLIAILALVLVHENATGVLTFDYTKLLFTPLSETTEFLLMLGFFIAFAVKLPIVPVHSWLPDAHAQAPTAGSVDLAGILLKTAAYGLLRFALPFFPDASQQFAPIAVLLGVIGIIYGAVLAFAQTDIKRLVAYTSISHMGFILLGVYSGTMISLQGVVMQMLAHGISAGALFILCGEIYERLHTRDITKMGGLWSRMKFLPPAMLFFTAASLGLPGLGNFVGEILILLGSFDQFPWLTIVAATGLILAALYSLRMFQLGFYGPTKSDAPLEDLTKRELALVTTLVAILLFMGLYPQPIFDATAPVMNQVINIYVGLGSAR